MNFWRDCTFCRYTERNTKLKQIGLLIPLSSHPHITPLLFQKVSRPFLIRKATEGRKTEREIGFSIEPGSFTMCQVTAGQEMKKEAAMCRQGLKSPSSLCFNFLCSASPRGLTFTWWGCCDLCQRYKPTELTHFFFNILSSCVCFCLYGPFGCISFHTFSRQLSAFSI